MLDLDSIDSHIALSNKLAGLSNGCGKHGPEHGKVQSLLQMHKRLHGKRRLELFVALGIKLQHLIVESVSHDSFGGHVVSQRQNHTLQLLGDLSGQGTLSNVFSMIGSQLSLGGPLLLEKRLFIPQKVRLLVQVVQVAGVP